jgi:hypothetical protein
MDPTLFQGAIDIVEYFDNTHPCPSFKGAYESWSEEIFTANEIEVAQEEQETLEAYTDLVGNILNLFIQSSLPVSNKKSALERKTHIQTLIDRPNVPQRTQAWYEQSRNVLTASEFSIILGTPRAVATLALQKTMPPRDPSQSSSSACSTYAMGPMDWGVRFEPVVKQILTTMWKANILDIGRLIHPSDSKLAASPDGLIQDASDEDRIGRLVEIKCPIRRVINDTVPFEYWCQMQIQMEVANIDECEYVEMKLVSPYRGDSEPYKAPLTTPQHSGNVWIVQDPTTCALVYAYTHEELKGFEEQGFAIIETIPWHLERMFNKVIVRDSAWFTSTKEKREEFWKIVEDVRTGTLVVPVIKRPKVVQPSIVVCKITDD